MPHYISLSLSLFLAALQRPFLEIAIPLHHPIIQSARICASWYNFLPAFSLMSFIQRFCCLPTPHLYSFDLHNITRLVHLLLSCLAMCPDHIHLGLAMVATTSSTFVPLAFFFFTLGVRFHFHKDCLNILCVLSTFPLTLVGVRTFS